MDRIVEAGQGGPDHALAGKGSPLNNGGRCIRRFAPGDQTLCDGGQLPQTHKEYQGAGKGAIVLKAGGQALPALPHMSGDHMKAAAYRPVGDRNSRTLRDCHG